MNRDQIAERLEEIRGRLQEIDNEYAGAALPEDVRTEWNELNDERERLIPLDEELEAREARLAEIAEDPESREAGATFQTRRPGTTRGDDIWDTSTARGMSLEDEARELTDRAHRAVEGFRFPHIIGDDSPVREHLEGLLARDEDLGAVARHVLNAGSPLYMRAFGRALAGRPLSSEEQRALSIFGGSPAGSEGGFVVPATLDPTLIPTSNQKVNPYRAISRTETITGNTWKGISASGISGTYGYADEAEEASDNSPTLQQPEATVDRAQAFIPFSIEVGQDWSGLQSEMGTLLQDAKDDLEADKFTNGSGNGEPEGLLTGATDTVDSGSASAFAAGDLYAVEEALGPRFRARAQWVGNRAIYNLVRQLDEAGGAALWVRLGQGLANQVPTPGNIGAELIGYPSNECSELDSTFTPGATPLVLGDFRYFLIIDRIGMSVEVIPHLMGSHGRPTGQRGLYAFWRNTSLVLASNAFRVLQVAAS
jgi:HK97 family phage major capsid protein